MSDIIELLPDSVANQIAAGEVIQRPASVVKELLENSVDAQASEIKLIVKDAGKSLIQVIDNGIGMSETDARMCFERHATSKIKKADDLFSIKTKGFRGEAMASIAAIAQVTLKTKKADKEIGTEILIEGSEVTRQEPVSSSTGTSIAVKNLFYNVPARRKFLKSTPVELRHIIDEFQRIALAHPEIKFELYSNDSDLFILPISPLRQRIVGLFGKNYNEKLVPIKEETSIVKLEGFIGKPEYAKKTRGEQFFFVNNRFIKSSYLNHAVISGYNELIGKDSHPSYFIFLEVNPELIDINIHPTKTEIKFEDEKSIYSIVRSAVRQSLGKYSLSPSLDFETETVFSIDPIGSNTTVSAPEIKVDKSFNPFQNEPSKEKDTKQNWSSTNLNRQKNSSENWEKLYESFKTNAPVANQKNEPKELFINHDLESEIRQNFIQLNKKYILTTIKSGFIVIHQQRAHERILYDKFTKAFKENKRTTQQLLFPKTVELRLSDMAFLRK